MKKINNLNLEDKVKIPPEYLIELNRYNFIGNEIPNNLNVNYSTVKKRLLKLSSTFNKMKLIDQTAEEKKPSVNIPFGAIPTTLATLKASNDDILNKDEAKTINEELLNETEPIKTNEDRFQKKAFKTSN